MKCPHCHKDIRPTDHFCPHCGYDLKRNPPRSTSILGRMMKGYLVIVSSLQGSQLHLISSSQISMN